MKKIFIIFCLLIFNFCIVYAKISDKKVDKVDIKLDDDALGIVFLNLDGSTALLLKYRDKYILYLFDYINDKNLENSYAIFTDYIDYIYMNNNYDYNIGKSLVVSDNSFGNLIFRRDRIIYKNKNICINQSNDCDLVFINKEDILLNEKVKAIFYSNDLNTKYIDYIKSFWADNYRLSKQSYTIVTIDSDYKVSNLVK